MELTQNINSVNLVTTLQNRRQKLSSLFPYPVCLWSGQAPARNFPANRYPFRASSHFLYFAGLSLDNAVIRLYEGKLELFMDDPPPEDALWHGTKAGRESIGAIMGADAAYPLAELAINVEETATIPVQHEQTYQQQCQILQRILNKAHCLDRLDGQLAEAIVRLRLIHDEAALQEIRSAIAVAIMAHKAGMQKTRLAQTESEVRAIMEGVILAANMTCAYGSIVTIQGEVLHNEVYHHDLRSQIVPTASPNSNTETVQNLLLADVGAETATGWASDLTRTWPVNGKFSPTQRAIYEIVLAAHDVCIEKMRSRVEYRDLHGLAATVLAEGLVDLGILRGNPASLVDQDAHTLFFPHGIGHLLGLDVHDMEDLGDLAGYEAGRARSDRFGWSYLRLDRPLRSGMVVTIEPGFYQVPAILNDPLRRERYRNLVNWDKLAQFNDVRGIRIEDDLLVTETGAEVLSQDLPTTIAAVEDLCRR